MRDVDFMIDIVGLIASVATLVLFCFYFFGRIWTINIKKKEKLETFIVEYIDYMDMDEKENEYDLGGNERLKIISPQSINWIRIYNVKYNFDNNKFIWDDKVLCKHCLLQSNEAIYFKITIPEGIPSMGVKFERFDYIKGSFIIGHNGRVGGMYPLEYKLENTIKSILYYMLK